MKWHIDCSLNEMNPAVGYYEIHSNIAIIFKNRRKYTKNLLYFLARNLDSSNKMKEMIGYVAKLTNNILFLLFFSLAKSRSVKKLK